MDLGIRDLEGDAIPATQMTTLWPGSPVIVNDPDDPISGVIQAVTFGASGLVSYLITLGDEEKRTYLPSTVTADVGARTGTISADPGGKT